MAPNSEVNIAKPSNHDETLKGVHKGWTSGGGPMAPRTCLRCGKVFDSMGRGNRLCGPCRGSSSAEHAREAKFHSPDIS